MRRATLAIVLGLALASYALPQESPRKYRKDRTRRSLDLVEVG